MGDKGDDLGEGMQCIDHPYRNKTRGICAFCLQEKLGKLVSSSNSSTNFCPIGGPSSSSCSPFKSEGGPTSATVAPTALHRNNKTPFLFAQYHKNNQNISSLILERSKSVAAPRARHNQLSSSSDDSIDRSRKKGFWSFLHLSSKRKSAIDNSVSKGKSSSKAKAVEAAEQMEEKTLEEESPNSSSHASSSFGRKVSRSRSVSCGSRSFSGDFLERISTGFGDCTLRRVESQRETKPKIVLHHIGRADEDRIKERVKCGGIFGGFGMISSSSSSSYWLSDDLNGCGGHLVSGGPPHGRSKSWSWAFASPMRAFRPSASSSSKSYIASVTVEKDGGISTTRQMKRNSNTYSNGHVAARSMLAVRG